VRARRLLLGFIAPASAVVLALLVSSIALLLIHKNPFTAFQQMVSYGIQGNSIIAIVNKAVPLFLSGLAVAIGFKMGLFNIGVESQYYLAALLAAGVGGALHLPAPIELTLILGTAVVVGASWALIPAVLKVTRGVHEVISTIMLNSVAVGIGSFLLARYLKRPTSASDLTTTTRPIPRSGWFPSLDRLFGIKNPVQELSGFLVVAILIGIGFYLLVWRTRFGFELRASGANANAARVSGVNPSAMIIKTMLLSGGLAGLVGMPHLLSFSHAYNLDFPTLLGFTGIAVALVGRNHPVGIGLAALLFGFLDRSAQILDLNEIPKEVVQIMQGVIILSVVVAYEVVRRLIQAQEVKATAEKAGAMARPKEEVTA
jgi:general nucleoside transport system permease protein